MKTVLSITLIVLTLGVTAQVDTLANRLNYTNYCLYKYQQENKIALAAELIGAGLIAFGNLDMLNGTDKANDKWAMGLLSDDVMTRINAEIGLRDELETINKRKDILTIVGGVAILGGGIIHVASYRWLKNAYIVPDDYGLTIGLKF